MWCATPWKEMHNRKLNKWGTAHATFARQLDYSDNESDDEANRNDPLLALFGVSGVSFGVLQGFSISWASAIAVATQCTAGLGGGL